MHQNSMQYSYHFLLFIKDENIVQGHVDGGEAGNPFQVCLSLNIIFCVVCFFFFLPALSRSVCAESEKTIVGKRE